MELDCTTAVALRNFNQNAEQEANLEHVKTEAPEDDDIPLEILQHEIHTIKSEPVPTIDKLESASFGTLGFVVISSSEGILCIMAHASADSDSDVDYYQNSDDDTSTDEEFSNTDEDEETESLQFGNWKLLSDPFSDRRASRLIEPNLQYETHPAVDTDVMKVAKECFEAFVSPKIVQFLCKWTNTRALMFLEAKNNLAHKINGLYWKDVSVNEMYVFISFLLLMGLTHVPKMHDYWKKTFLLGGPPVFSKDIMSRDRFFTILKFLRFSDPAHVNVTNPITRLAMFFAYIRENTTILVDLGETCAIDECLMLYKGRLHFKQFIKTKRSRFGLKLFCLCPSHPRLRGYTYNFALYTGKDIYNIEHIAGAEGLSMSERIVVYLLQNSLDEGREVILDNWYLSVRLAEFLLTKNTYVTGTINVNRGVPKEISTLPLKKYQSCFLRNNDTLIVRFRDKRDVHVLTTKLTANFQEKQRYDKSEKAIISYKRPKHIEHYNYNMGAVDSVDQDIEPYNAARNNYSWFKKLGIHILQRMVLNAKVLYEISNNKKIPFAEFTVILCDELLQCYSPNYKKKRDLYNSENLQKSTAKKRRQENHELIRQPQEEQKRRRCWICYNIHKNKNKYTYLFCSICEVAICSKEHFEDYHNK